MSRIGPNICFNGHRPTLKEGNFRRNQSAPRRPAPMTHPTFVAGSGTTLKVPRARMGSRRRTLGSVDSARPNELYLLTLRLKGRLHFYATPERSKTRPSGNELTLKNFAVRPIVTDAARSEARDTKDVGWEEANNLRIGTHCCSPPAPSPSASPPPRALLSLPRNSTRHHAASAVPLGRPRRGDGREIFLPPRRRLR
jgi:hypothetical protein